MPISQPHILHRLLVAVGKLPIHGHMLINRQRFPLCMSRDELEFGTARPREFLVSQVIRLVPEGMRSRLNTRFSGHTFSLL